MVSSPSRRYRWIFGGFALIATVSMLRDSRGYLEGTMTRMSDAAWQSTMPVVYNYTTEWWPAAADTTNAEAAPAVPPRIGPTPKPKSRDNATVSGAYSRTTNTTGSMPPSNDDYDSIYLWGDNPTFANHKFCRWYNKGSNQERVKFQKRLHWQQMKGNTTRRHERGEPRRILMQLRFDCYRILKESSFGTGNWIQMLLMLRLAAAGTARSSSTIMEVVDLTLSCTDGDSHQAAKSLVLPWIMGNFSASETLQILSRYWGKHEIDFRCHERAWGSLPIGWAIPLFQQDLRRMAVALVGVPKDPEHPAFEWLLLQQLEHSPNATFVGDIYQHASPLIPNVTLDDVVIHFRCGDTMISKYTYFRFLKYHEFSSRIDPTTTSIGIVTQPFGKEIAFYNETIGEETEHDQARERDVGDPFRDFVCRRVILNFQDHLQAKFPNARVSIHNSRDETVALAYARMVMAKKQAFAFPDSSFSIYPVLATFGAPVFFYPTESSGKNSFLRKFRDNIFPQHNDLARAQWMDVSSENSLFAIETLHMSQMHGDDNQAHMQAAKDILEWFTNETLVKPHFHK